MARFQAVVHKKTTSYKGALNSAARPLLVDDQGKELLPDPDKPPGHYIGTGKQRIDNTTTPSIDDPLTDDQGNTVEAGTVDALLRRVKEIFSREEHENVEIQKVVIQEIKTIQEVTGEELRRL